MDDRRPWYREPMVWLLISFPLAAVIGGIATYIIADRTRDGLVVDDYYRRGKEINLDLARDQVAERHRLQGSLNLDARPAQVVLVLHADRGLAMPPSVTIRWLHATRSGLDQTQTLVRRAPGDFRAVRPELAPGRWYVQVEADDWRLQGTLTAPGDRKLVLRPSGIR